jgi:triacylglycerol lipase
MLKTNDAERAAFIERLRALGTAVSPPLINGSIALYKPLHAGISTANVQITRDVRYGEADRHRLDLFVPAGAKAGTLLPVLLFVHGGGFVGGDKSNPDSPFYDNVGLWAARNGCIGVTMTYRLAPQHRWPAGSEDVGRAVNHLRTTLAAHGGDADKLFIIGQSAGATHVGGYLANEQSPGRDGWRPAGAALISGLFDTHTMEKNALFAAYFGSDPAQYADRPFLAGLARTQVPLLVVLAEFDPPDFLRQSVALLDAYLQQHQRLPRFYQLGGHNHLSTILHLNTADEALAVPLREFMSSILDSPAR